MLFTKKTDKRKLERLLQNYKILLNHYLEALNRIDEAEGAAEKAEERAIRAESLLMRGSLSNRELREREVSLSNAKTVVERENKA